MGIGLNQIACLDSTLWISDSEAAVKTEKSRGVAGGEGECADDVAGEKKTEFGYFACEKRSKAVCTLSARRSGG